MINGQTELVAENVIDILAASNGGSTVLKNLENLAVGTVTFASGYADEMEVIGITSADTDVKLTNNGDIEINQAIQLGQAACLSRPREI